MNVTEAIEKKGIKIENLTPDEQQTYFSMLDAVKQAQMTPDKLKEYVISMREAVAKELVNEPSFIRIFLFKVENPKLIKLQARLQNYLLLESFLISPAKAEEQLKSMIDSIGRK